MVGGSEQEYSLKRITASLSNWGSSGVRIIKEVLMGLDVNTVSARDRLRYIVLAHSSIFFCPLASTRTWGAGVIMVLRCANLHLKKEVRWWCGWLCVVEVVVTCCGWGRSVSLGLLSSWPSVGSIQQDSQARRWRTAPSLQETCRLSPVTLLYTSHWGRCPWFEWCPLCWNSTVLNLPPEK